MVSIHKVPVDVFLIISVVCFIFRFKYVDQIQYVTLVSFNSNKVNIIYDCCPIHRIKEFFNKIISHVRVLHCMMQRNPRWGKDAFLCGYTKKSWGEYA